MKTAFKKHFILILVFLLIFSVCGFFSVRKQGMFVDEIYTYGLSNGYYTPFVVSIPEGEVVGSVISSEEFTDYLTVGNDDAFAVASVYYNQAQDVHPPLYYWLFNFHRPSGIYKMDGACARRYNLCARALCAL